MRAAVDAMVIAAGPSGCVLSIGCIAPLCQGASCRWSCHCLVVSSIGPLQKHLVLCYVFR